MFQRGVVAAFRATRLKVVALAAALFAVAAVSSAAADEWQVGKVTGQVFVSSPQVQPAAVKTGMVLRSGQTLQTAKDGRAFLTHGNDSVAVGPNTVISVPAAPGYGMTKLIQQSGFIELDVEKLGQPHLMVETPYLAAVVKGTHFTVTVANGSAKVAVTRGLVQVTDYASRKSVDVAAGQQATVRTSTPGVTVTGVNAAPAVVPPVVPGTRGAASNETTASVLRGGLFGLGQATLATSGSSGNDNSSSGSGNSGNGSGDRGNDAATDGNNGPGNDDGGGGNGNSNGNGNGNGKD